MKKAAMKKAALKKPTREQIDTLKRLRMSDENIESVTALCGELSEDLFAETNFSRMDLRNVYLRDKNLNGNLLCSTNLAGANLCRANLEKADLRHAKLTNTNLQRAKLSDADMRVAKLESADLSHAKLHQTKLNHANLSLSNLQNADLQNANLREAKLKGANLQGANLQHTILIRLHARDANLQNTNLTGADLRAANLIGANLKGADLQKANLQSAIYDNTTQWPKGFNIPYGISFVQPNAHLQNSDLDYQNLENIDLQEAYLHSANFVHSKLNASNLQKADLVEAKLQQSTLNDANLNDASLEKANLYKSELKHTQLQNTNLTQAYLKDADLSAAILKRTNLCGANLRGVQAENTVFEHVVYNENTIHDDLPFSDSNSHCIAMNSSLQEADLRNYVLAYADLNGANLQKAQLECADLHGANLQNANLSGANLQNAQLECADLRGANLKDARTDEANFKNALYDQETKWPHNFDLEFCLKEAQAYLIGPKANLCNANLGMQDFREANLDGANVSYANLRGANLRGAKLTQVGGLEFANLSGALYDRKTQWPKGSPLVGAYCIEPRSDLQEANLSGLDLRGANLQDANLSGADLQETKLHKAHLENANLTISNLSYAQLVQSNLQKAKLWNANLFQANLKEANLKCADLRFANLERANLQNTILKHVLYNEETIWPKGFDPQDYGAYCIDANSDLEGAKLENVDLHGANLKGANLKGANLSGTNLFGVVYDEKTIWPKDFNVEQSGAMQDSDDQIEEEDVEKIRLLLKARDSESLFQALELIEIFATNEHSLYRILPKARQCQNLKTLGAYFEHSYPSEQKRFAYRLLKSMAQFRIPWARSLTTLRIEDEGASLIWEIVEELPLLESLSLERCSIHQLPKFIKNHTQLRSLSLPSNALQEFPNILLSMPNLRELNLSYNEISYIPESIEELHALEKLDLSNNKLSSLPKSFEHLRNLKQLRLCGNENAFYNFPKELHTLAQSCIVDENGELIYTCNIQFSEVYDTSPIEEELAQFRIASLSTLDSQLRNRIRTLDLSNAQLTTLPQSLCTLPNLEILNLHQNNIESLPENISSLQSLRNLDVSENKLHSLPDSICNLKELQYLNLNANPLKHLPEDIGDLCNLKELSLEIGQTYRYHWRHRTYLPISLPDSMVRLLSDIHFKDFFQHGCTIKVNPNVYGRLNFLRLKALCLSDHADNIKKMSLCGMRLTSLPKEIQLLRNLRHLDLSFNEISSLPDSMYKEDLTCVFHETDIPKLQIGYRNLVHIRVQCTDIFKIQREGTEEFEGRYGYQRTNYFLPKKLGKPYGEVDNRHLWYVRHYHDSLLHTSEDVVQVLLQRDFSLKTLHLEGVESFYLPKRIRHFSIRSDIPNTTCIDKGFVSNAFSMQVSADTQEGLDTIFHAQLDFIFQYAIRNPDFARNITEINLKKCGLRQLPQGIENFQNLEILRINKNPLQELPNGVAFLSKLRILDLEGTQIKELPIRLGNATKLTHLYIQRTPNLVSIPQSLTQCPRLRIYHKSMGKSGMLSSLPKDQYGDCTIQKKQSYIPEPAILLLEMTLEQLQGASKSIAQGARSSRRQHQEARQSILLVKKVLRRAKRLFSMRDER